MCDLAKATTATYSHGCCRAHVDMDATRDPKISGNGFHAQCLSDARCDFLEFCFALDRAIMDCVFAQCFSLLFQVSKLLLMLIALILCVQQSS